MLLGARQFFERRGAPAWTNPYVTDGLVAMWDGEWNAGGGVHDANATSWVDLSGNGYDITLPSSGATWDADHIALSSVSLNTYLPEVRRAEFTIECVASAAGSGAIVWMKNPSWVGGALVGWANGNGKCYYPWANIGTIGDLNLHSVSLSWSASSQRLLVDGSVIASTSGAINSRNVLSQIFLGEYNGIKMSSMNGYSVRLYSRALTATEIAANNAVDKQRFNLP
jgi:hypothetical protein